MIWIAKLLISAGLFAWLLMHSDLSRVVSSLQALTLGAVMEVAAMFLIAVAIGTFKWWLLIPKYRISQLFGLTFIGIFYSIVLPGQIAGEVVKAYRLGVGKLDAEAIAASVMIDKVNGLIGLLGLGIIGVACTKLAAPHALLGMFAIALTVGIVGLFSIHAPGLRHLVAKLVGRVDLSSTRLARIRSGFALFLSAWAQYARRPALMGATVVLSMGYHLLSIAMILVVAPYFNIHVPVTDWLWIFALVSVAVLLPISIGGLGVREGAFIGALGLFSVAPSSAMALSLTIFGSQLAAAFVGGSLELRDTLSRRESKGLG